MKKIAVLAFTPGGEVLLKIKMINGRKLLVPFEAWQKWGETERGTIERIKEEIATVAPPERFIVRFTRIEKLKINTKFREATKVYYVCHLPFEPVFNSNSEMVVIKKEDLAKFKKEIPQEDYIQILKALGIQNSLTDFI